MATTLEQIAPRLAKAHQAAQAAARLRRPCGRLGYCCACWVAAERRQGTRLRHEPTPWRYGCEDRRYARDWPYTLLIHPGGFMQRVYDWELEHPIRHAR